MHVHERQIFINLTVKLVDYYFEAYIKMESENS